MASRPLVLQTEDLDPAAQAWLRERCELAECRLSEPERLRALLAEAEGVVVRTYTRVDGAFLDMAPRLRCVARAGVGLDRIDVAACRARGVEVVHTPDANTVAVAEYVFAMLFDALRPRVFLDGPISAERWTQTRRELTAPRQLSELTLGVYGLGKIGSRVARTGVGLGMDVIYHDLRDVAPTERCGATPVSREELLRTSDVLSIHVDPRHTNRHLLNAGAFALARPTLIFVNTSRGMIVDPSALAAFLATNPGAQALVDVHDPEPFDENYPLVGIPNAHLSPHLAACTQTAHENMSWVVRDLWRVLQGDLARYPAPNHLA